MTEKELNDMKEFFYKTESKIKTNLKGALESIYYTYDNIAKNNEDLLKVEKGSEYFFKIFYSKYIITFVIDSNMALTKSDIRLLENNNISYKGIFSNEQYQKYYCGCINVYYKDVEDNNRTFYYLDRIYVNSCNEVAFKSDTKYVNFEDFETVKSKLTPILLLILGNVFNAQPMFPEPKNVYAVDYDDLGNVSSIKDTIGFK